MLIKKWTALCCAVVLLLAAIPRAGAAETVKLPILMYHHISTDPDIWGNYVISPETFEGDLAYLQDKGYTAISIRQLVDYVEGRGELPEKPVMLTFDDGQLSFMQYALPLLEQYNSPAVAAIVGRYADLYTENGDRDVRYAYLNWEDLHELSRHPLVELQAHTYDMHSLENRPGCSMHYGETLEAYTKAFNGDLAQINQRFEKYIGSIPTAFAYPYGIRCPEGRALLQSAGYKAIFTCDERVNTIRRGNPDCLLELGRFNRPHSASREAFFARMGIV